MRGKEVRSSVPKYLSIINFESKINLLMIENWWTNRSVGTIL